MKREIFPYRSDNADRLLGRAFNRRKQGIATISDNNVIAYRCLPVDIDPVRPSGISSNDFELQEAYQVRERIVAWVDEHWKLADPVKAMGGN